ncbi:DUF6473 family protein [Tropicimonas sp.]|uniref:DUF6473 family protein n=1 Tax=Tropicimonas sp. TaxID=2067044 RepID=UPI003A8C7FF8
MAFEHPGDGALDYCPCRYGRSKQSFRGPRKALDAPYVAFLGGTETYGRFVEVPFPELTERATGYRAVNLGCVNGGIDLYVQDPELLGIATGARLTVIQAMGAQNLSNRFYTVHPRRNDRFIGVSPAMKSAFPAVDFTDFAFTGHLLASLLRQCPAQFDLIVDELKSAWLARMRQLIDQIHGPIVLLWIGTSAPTAGGCGLPDPLSGPAFVDRYMIDELRPLVDDWVIGVAGAETRDDALAGLGYADIEAPAAARAANVPLHRQVTASLSPVVARILE